ncbi:MAG: adenylate/guanylate cyclase domain-containing protein [Deltaproteobacteria bacterium]|nr:adenylate/guanylate cyclase domain-containing protein [Myxococcales bacterium]MDP3220660.1 adenylate/guanylate cyclase domain-containing protein [Deltaproteobacteria bacterium]
MATLSDVELKGSEVRLWNLIEQRSRPGADVARIDQRIWDLFGEEWAVMFTDLAGFSRQVEAFGIIHFLQEIFEQKRLLLPIVSEHDGVLIKIEADSFLILFKRAASAVRCAVEMQRACQRFNDQRPPESQVLLCVGIGYGRVLRIGDLDVFGAEVNAASKLGEDIAKANEVLVTQAVRDAAGALDGLSFSEYAAVVPGAARCFLLDYPR